MVAMRIVHVVETLERGGLERMVCDLAASQHAAGHRVQVVCLFRPGLLAEELRAVGVSVVAAGKRSGVADALATLWRLRSLVRAAHADVIHTHNATAHYHTVLALAPGRHPPLLNTRHGMGAAAGDGRERWYRRTWRRTSIIVAVCRHAAQHLIAAGLAPAALTTVVPNGIRLERFACGDRRAARRLLGIADDAPVVGTVGRLNWAKDHELLLRAFAKVREAVPQAVLVLIGEGELRTALSRRADELGLVDCVRFLGDRGDVAQLLAGFDVFVLSSRTEGYSIALLEASAAGLPIVATDVGGNCEIVADGRSGRLVPAADAVALAAAISQILEHAPLRQAWGAAARAWAEQHAGISAMAHAYEVLYARAAGKGPLR